MNSRLTVFAGIFCLLASPGRAVVRHVPGDYPDLASAIQAAQAGDVVEAAAGTYTGPGNRALNPAGKAITIRSASGPAATILDCQGAARAFTMTSLETRATVIDGFTIRNGRGQDGGGIGLWNATSPIVRNCVFEDCGVSGGLSEGGGIRAAGGASPLVENCTFNRCAADYGGGLMAIQGSNAEVRGCTFTGCTGAGIYLWDHSSAVIAGCVFLSNTDSSLSFGAGIACFDHSDAQIDNCYLRGGTMTWNGAGINISNANPTVRHCTIVENTGYNGTGGVMAENSSGSFTNCIVWDNAGQQIRDLTGGLTVRYCDVEGGYAGTGNFDSPPGFAGAGDYHLSGGSACIDSGTNAGLSVDIDGDSRPQGAGYDVGCDETGGSASAIDCSLSMPAHHFVPSDSCWLALQIDNSGPAAGSLPVFVLLDVYGAYYFWPSWTSFDYSAQAIPAGSTNLTILPAFTWPAGAGSAAGLAFLAAVTDPAVSYLMGAAASWQFGFSE